MIKHDLGFLIKENLTSVGFKQGFAAPLRSPNTVSWVQQKLHKCYGRQYILILLSRYVNSGSSNLLLNVFLWFHSGKKAEDIALHILS